jgi:hypothetical protein
MINFGGRWYHYLCEVQQGLPHKFIHRNWGKDNSGLLWIFQPAFSCLAYFMRNTGRKSAI